MAVKKESNLSKEIKPITVSFKNKVKEDKVFLLSLIDDPVKTFNTYGFNGDEKMMSMLEGMSNNLRQRAIQVYTEILGLAQAGQACDACNGCRACKACSSIPAGGQVIK